MSKSPLEQVVELSHRLGSPEMDCAILGEGNTSAREDEKTFWVKASGSQLANIKADGFVLVSFERVLALLENKDLSDADVKKALTEAKSDPAATGHPSVETLLHAVLLSIDGVNFVGHTHPTAINSLTCSQVFPKVFKGRLFPDEIVLCGVAPLLIPYTDPGIPLARKVRKSLHKYLDKYGERPKIVLMQNHGLIALGGTPQAVEDITAMEVKTARVLLGTLSAGGPLFMTEEAVGRIHTRPDEHYRQQILGLQK